MSLVKKVLISGGVTSDSFAPKNTITVRRPDFDFEREIPKHWFGNNPVATHNFNGYNLLFPEFERFFMRSVLYYKPIIKNEELLGQVKSFVGQESMHAKGHEEYFSVLRRQGYKIDRFLRMYQRYAGFIESMAAPKLRIALTAAAEHYTATIAGVMVSHPELIEDVDPTMKKLMVWHSAEEIEHRSVAFDVMEVAGVTYPLRILAFLMTSLDMLLWATLGTLMFLRQDKISLFKSFKYKRKFRKKSVPANKQFKRSLFAYFRRDFHPSQYDYVKEANEQLKEVGIND